MLLFKEANSQLVCMVHFMSVVAMDEVEVKHIALFVHRKRRRLKLVETLIVVRCLDRT